MPEHSLDATAALRPYLPRLLIEWLAEAPGTTLRTIDGTMVFADISGFTKMSERLARKGRVGAEELTDVIEAVFTRLLSVAYGEGGGLIKFGGDALLLWFSGQGHPTKGARAAVGMRQALRGIGPIQTTAGNVSLRMSVGLHSGGFHFFLVGDRHRELIITGPAASETVSMEGTAVAGEILASRATTELLPPQTLGRPKGDGILLRSAPKDLPGAWPAIEASLEGVDLLSCIPIALREHVVAGVTDPGHRRVTVAFVHFDGIDELLRSAGAEVVAYGLDELVRVVQGACEKHAVTFLDTDIDRDGGKIYLVSGAPSALGDDAERLLLTAREIVDAGTTIPVRIGVNRGPIFAGDIGPSYRRTYAVMGDTVNLAARVMAKAGPRQVLTTASVLDDSQTLFDLVELEPFSVKGKAKPVQAWSVGQPIGTKGRQGTGVHLDLVGRRAELGILDEAVRGARDGSGRIIELVGEPGIGKSRLVAELRDRAEGLTVLHATCEAFTSTTPYIVWRDVLRQLLGLEWEDPNDVVLERLMDRIRALDPELETWLSLIALPFDVEIPPSLEVELLGEEYRRAKLNEVVLAFLRRVASAVTLIVVEDSHHMDEASADLFHALAGAIGELPWLVCIARRTGDAGFVARDGEGVITLELGPLDTHEALAMATAATGENPLIPHYLDAVANRSGGNPQFLLDMLDALSATGSLEHLPDSVESAAMAHIDRLPPGDRTLVRHASVFGLAFHPRMLGWLSSGDSPLSADEGTWGRLDGLFEDEGGGYLRFRRAVVRDAAYGGLPFRTRRRLHAAVAARHEAEHMDPEEISGILSLHFSLAGDHQKAWHYARIAGNRAQAMFAHNEASTLYQRAIDAGQRAGALQSDLIDVLELRGDALGFAGEYQHAADVFARARQLAKGDPVRRAKLALKRSRIEDRLGRYRRALAWLTRGRKELEEVPDVEAARLRARFAAWYATVLQAEGRYARARRWCAWALEEADAVDDREALAQTYNALFFIALSTGDPVEGYLREALRLYRDLGDLVGESKILHNLGVGAYFSGRWDESIEYFEQAVEASAKIGDSVAAAHTSAMIGEVLSDQGLLVEAEAQLRGSLRILKAAGDGLAYGDGLAVLGRAVLRAGRPEESLALLREARAVFATSGAQSEIVGTDARIAECQVSMGESEVALELATAALSSASVTEDGTDAPLLHRTKGYALAQLGDLAGAKAAFEDSLRVGRERGADHEVALTLHGLIRLSLLQGEEIDPEIAIELSALLERLHVIAVPVVPLLSYSDPGTPRAAPVGAALA